MKIERIDENRIKVIVNRDDVKIWNVDLKNFIDNTPEAQDMFWFALKQAERDVNFSVGSAQLMLEAMPTANEGFAMVISKLETEADIAKAILKSGKRIKKAEFKLDKNAEKAPLIRILQFDSFDFLCDGVAEIRELYIGESRLFKYKNKFYLELLPVDAFGLFEIENVMSEFSTKIKRPHVMQGLLNEHAELMIPVDAVRIINENFNK